MRQILKRFGIYLLVLLFLGAIFNSWPPLPPSGASGARLVYYYVGLWFSFGVTMLFGALCFELLYRVFRWKANWVELRRSKESEQIKLK